MDLAKYIRDVPDFPKKGIVFKDITTLLAEPRALKHILDVWQERYRGMVNAVVAIESRGFIFGAPLADRLGVKFIPARKPGKLPYETLRREYALEYGTDAIHMHVDALAKGDQVVVVDDLLATGGTALAAAQLVTELGAEVKELAFVVELSFLKARSGKLAGYPVHSFVTYDSE